jgi:hypothetical protein
MATTIIPEAVALTLFLATATRKATMRKGTNPKKAHKTFVYVAHPVQQNYF